MYVSQNQSWVIVPVLQNKIGKQYEIYFVMRRQQEFTEESRKESRCFKLL